MSIWKKILDKSHAFFKIEKELPSNCRELTIANERVDLDFATSVVALAAKMAKADGITTRDEMLAFEAAFPAVKEDKAIFERVFTLASGSVLGFEGYARKINKKYPSNRLLKMDILSILFLVAIADGQIKPIENEFLVKVSENLGLTKSDYDRVSDIFLPNKSINPYVVLGVHESDSDETIKSAWLKIVAQNHPDNFIGSGRPADFLKIANEKTAMANSAYTKIKEERLK